MEGTDHNQLIRLASRQEKQKLFKSALRARLKPLQKKRLALIATLETATSDFLTGAIPSTTDEALAPFDHVFVKMGTDLSLCQLRDNLQRQSRKASERCKRYEKEFNIYHLGETLPELEERLTQARALMLAAHRRVEELSQHLAPVLALNDKLGAQQKPVIDQITLASVYARPASATRHTLRWLTDSTYREVCHSVAAFEKTHGSLPVQIEQFSRSQTDLLVREQEHDLLTREVETTRNWLQAYVEDWASRLNDTQILGALRQAVADQMQSPDVRAALDATSTTRLPDSLRQIYRDVEALDHRIHSFYSSFEARHAAGRIETNDGDMQDRRRTPSTIGTSS